MTVAELKDVAAEKNISVAGMKKAEIIEALSK
ncbi:MAG: Rho termination factor N-terminal domain-containing protein [Mollicutes bacterium]|nr:Rho termination factor N-terminal domain-containing protein [Mollicutes bacterium]MDY5874597.1 Rho termination factor N-terminal domain-containing protein [Bacilli bacterium]